MRSLLRFGIALTVLLVLGKSEVTAAGRVEIEIHGLFAFVPYNKGYKAVCLSPRGAPHFPMISVNPSDIHEDNTTPGFPSGTGGGDARYSWLFTDGSIDMDNVKNNKADFKPNKTPLDKIDDDTDLTKIRWVPQMGDILNVDRLTVKDSVVNAAAGRFTIEIGEIVPLFDYGSHTCQRWTIGSRAKRQVADGFEWTILLTDSDEPFTVDIGSAKKVLIKSGSTIDLTCYSGLPPKMDHEHFVHFYDLIDGEVQKKHLPSKDTDKCMVIRPLTPNPARCAPVLFP